MLLLCSMLFVPVFMSAGETSVKVVINRLKLGTGSGIGRAPSMTMTVDLSLNDETGELNIKTYDIHIITLQGETWSGETKITY